MKLSHQYIYKSPTPVFSDGYTQHTSLQGRKNVKCSRPYRL